VDIDPSLRLRSRWITSNGQDGQRAAPSGVDLAGLDLRGVDLRADVMTGAVLRGTNLADASPAVRIC
jgi:uncharacterized protein YjbI with pentapeptide repeats